MEKQLGARDQTTLVQSTSQEQPVQTAGPTPESIRIERQVWEDVLREAGARYRHATLETFRMHGTEDEQQKQAKLLGRIKEFCRRIRYHLNCGHNVVFLGTCGTGKDHLQIGMVREAIRMGCTSIRWADAAETFGSFKDAIGDHVAIGDMLRTFVHPQLLVLSDLVPANEPLSEFESSILFRLINWRCRLMKSTWVSMNVDTAEAAEAMIGAKTLSRLEQDAFVARLEWQDYRKRKRC